MRTISWLLSIIATTLICSCSPSNDSKPEGVLTDAQKKTLEKAKQTEEVLKEANEKRMKEIDETK